MHEVPGIRLNDGHTIPQLGFGTWAIPPRDAAGVVRDALAAGYRQIDTGQVYGNEQGVGEAIRTSDVEREDVYITSKLSNALHLPDDARRGFDQTLAAIGSDYIDLFLIHWPLPTLFDGDFVSTWRTLQQFKSEGRARSIGVSNFGITHLERLAAESDEVPVVNQIEANPYFANDEVRAYGSAHGIVTQAWAPLAKGKTLAERTVIGIAARLARTPSQVVVRWHIQRGDVIFPKTLAPARMRENLEVFDFELAHDDMTAITDLDRGEAGREGPHPDTCDWVPDSQWWADLGVPEPS